MADQINYIVYMLYNIYFFMILIYVLMSWLPNVRESFIGELLGKLVEPYLTPFRRIIPALFGTLDISPIIALLVLDFAKNGLMYLVDKVF